MIVQKIHIQNYNIQKSIYCMEAIKNSLNHIKNCVHQKLIYQCCIHHTQLHTKNFVLKQKVGLVMLKVRLLLIDWLNQDHVLFYRRIKINLKKKRFQSNRTKFEQERLKFKQKKNQMCINNKTVISTTDSILE